MYAIVLVGGDYLEERGGFDWGRVAAFSHATKYDTIENARDAARTYRLAAAATVTAIEDYEGRTYSADP